MKALQIALVGINNSGKSTVVEKLQQKKELESEKFSVYSFKQGDSLIYLADTPYNMDAPKEMVGLIKEADGCLICVSAVEGVNQKFGELIILLNSLKVNQAVVAITKTDSSTSDEVDALKNKLNLLFNESSFKGAQIIGVSSIMDEGFTELRESLIKLAPKNYNATAKFKMAVEVAKELKSGLTTIFGVIQSGTIKKYDKVIVMPWGKEFVVQEISLHGEIVENAKAGDRVGLFFKGLYPWDVQMGDIVTVENNTEKSKDLIIDFKIVQFFKDELKNGNEVMLNIGVQTFPVSISKILKDGNEVQSAKGGDKVEIVCKSKLPFAFEKNQDCVIINPEAHWRSIKVVGSGKVLGALNE